MPSKLSKLLVIRFSALGDVALTVPAVQQILFENPDCEIIFLSRPFLSSLFYGIDRLQFHGVDTNKYKGFWELIRLANELFIQYKIDTVIDLHNSLRSRIIRYFFAIRGIPSFVIDKGRSEKKKLISIGKQPEIVLKHHLQRYLDVFANAGLQLGDKKKAYLIHISPEAQHQAQDFIQSINTANLIGIAPFAAFPMKEWSLEKVKQLALHLVEKSDNAILLFGGKDDLVKLQSLISTNKRIVSAIGVEGGLATELAIMKHLRVMICMDSGNMHLAAGVGTKVAAIFGATHPNLGFAPYLQTNHIIQDTELNCRPCSVFGNKPCHRGDHACMQNITVARVQESIITIDGN